MNAVEDWAVSLVIAQDKRNEVCRGDCDWPRGDGECFYCQQVGQQMAGLRRAVKDSGEYLLLSRLG